MLRLQGLSLPHHRVFAARHRLSVLSGGHFGESDQSLGDGESGQAGDAVDLELSHQALAMGFDGAGADVEATRNFLVGQTLGDTGEHLAFTIGEVGLLEPWSVPTDQSAENKVSNIGTEKGRAGVHRFYGLQDDGTEGHGLKRGNVKAEIGGLTSDQQSGGEARSARLAVIR